MNTFNVYKIFFRTSKAVTKPMDLHLGIEAVE